MRNLEQRAAEIGRMAQRRKTDEIARALQERGVATERRDYMLFLSSKGLIKRWLSEASLRFVGSLLR